MYVLYFLLLENIKKIGLLCNSYKLLTQPEKGAGAGGSQWQSQLPRFLVGPGGVVSPGRWQLSLKSWVGLNKNRKCSIFLALESGTECHPTGLA